MRWIVEAAPIGSKESQSYCVEADSWQKGLQTARKLRGDNAPMSGFSIELMNDGCKAVDPASRIRYEVRRTGDDTPLTAGGEAPPSRKSVRPPRAAPKKGKSEAPPQASEIPPIYIKREQDPTAETPLTYREYAFGVAKGSTPEAAQAVLRGQLERIQADLAPKPAGKLVNLAAFDDAFEGRPKVLPLVTLTWKDWRPDVTFAFPRRDRAGASPVSGSRPTAVVVAAPVPVAAPVFVPVAAPVVPVAAPVPAQMAPAPVVAAQPVKRPAQKPQTPAVKAPKRVAGDELIAVLFESMHDMHFLRDAIEAGDFCLSLAADRLPSRVAFIHFYDIDRREYVLVCARGQGTDALLTGRNPESEPLLSAAMRKRRGMFLNDNNKLLDSSVFTSVNGAKSAVIAPVMQSGRFLGAITLIDPLDGAPFTELDANAMSYMAEQLAEYLGARGIVVDPERVKEPKSAPS